MKIKIYEDYIIHLNYKTQYELCSTFMRLQEFYESPYPELQGRFFSLEKIMDIYAKNMGNFTYTTDWSGFNVPDIVIRDFNKMFRNNFLEKEKVLFDIIKGYLKRGHPFYLIGSYGNNKETIRHEIAHALWYLNDNYLEEMYDNVINCDPKVILEFEEYLLKKGYCKEMINDEIQAYFSTDRYNIKEKQPFVKTFVKTFNKYTKGMKI